MKLSSRLSLIALTSMMLGAGIAHAEPYVGVNLGKSEQKLDWLSHDDTDLAWKLYGGYNFTKTFGVEGGYVSHGKVDMNWSGSNVTSRAATLYLAGTATVPLSAQFALIGKLGIADNRHKWNFGGGTLINTTAMAGVGVSYAFSPTMSAVVEYEDFGKVYNRDQTEVKARTLSVGLRKSF